MRQGTLPSDQPSCKATSGPRPTLRPERPPPVARPSSTRRKTPLRPASEAGVCGPLSSPLDRVPKGPTDVHSAASPRRTGLRGAVSGGSASGPNPTALNTRDCWPEGIGSAQEDVRSLGTGPRRPQRVCLILQESRPRHLLACGGRDKSHDRTPP